VGEISQAIGSAPGNSSAMCKTLEKKGLVSRNRSLEDERIVLIAITPAGSTLLKLIEGELSSKFDPTLEQFSAEDFEEIISGMEKLRKVVNSLHDAFETNQARR
jgi:DNA-binding MarR family transcriptional regulator